MLKISCPKCGKNEKAELIEVQTNRRYTFKCHHCDIFFDLSGEEGDKKEIVHIFPGKQKADDPKSDRRKNIRFLVQDSVAASLHNGLISSGKVKDISVGGLCLEHMEPLSDEISEKEYLNRNIFLSVNGFSLFKAACKIVYDISIETPNEYPGASTRFLTRRCGVQFETLTEDQANQLDLFFEAYTKGVAISWSQTTKQRS